MAADSRFARTYTRYLTEIAEETEANGEKLDVRDATQPSDQTPAELATWQRRQRATQFVVPVLAGATIVCGSYLVQSYRAGATAKGVLRRLLPD
jgi:hypothetical protein